MDNKTIAKQIAETTAPPSVINAVTALIAENERLRGERDAALAHIEAILANTEKEPAPGGYTYTLNGAAIEEARQWVDGLEGGMRKSKIMKWSLIINNGKSSMSRWRCTSGDNAKTKALKFYREGSAVDFLITVNGTKWASCNNVDKAGRLKWKYV